MHRLIFVADQNTAPKDVVHYMFYQLYNSRQDTLLNHKTFNLTLVTTLEEAKKVELNKGDTCEIFLHISGARRINKETFEFITAIIDRINAAEIKAGDITVV